MIVTTFMGIIAVFFAYLARYKNLKFGLKVSFSVIFLFLAIRYSFGNDYSSYLDKFIEINNYASFNYSNKENNIEPGWIFLCKLFQPLGFFAMIAVLALFNCVIYYRLIKKYVPIEYYWLAVFLYIFTPGFMLTHSSAMRQSIAIALFIFSFDFLYKRNAIKYFLCVGIALLFHNSALIVLPVFLLSYINWKINNLAIVIVVGVFASLFVFIDLLGPYLTQFISIYFDQYENYQDAVVIGTGLGIIYLSVLFTLTLYYEKYQNKEVALIFKIAIFSFFFIPLGLLIQLIGRMAMYFTPALIIAYPMVAMNMKTFYRRIYLATLLLMTMLNFVQFFESETYKEGFKTYQTIFSSRKWH